MTLFHQSYGEGYPLLILHGLLGASGNWHTLSRNVFSHSFAVHALDLRNHGRSPHSPSMSYAEMAGDVLEFMDAEGMETAHMMGHSMGGKVAMTFALTYPDRLGRLVVADVAPRAYPPHHTSILNALRRLDLNAFDSRAAVDDALAHDITSKPIRQFLLKNLSAEPDGSFTWKMNLDAIDANYDALSQAVEPTGIFSGDALFIRGGDSNYVTDEDVPSIHRLFPSAQISTISGASHWLHAEAPDVFGAAVMVFLGR
ncbi:MAG: alpha/beta fold hydrolase [Rhodothermales bacterium]|nr:alpha/beta fold hydrolase [Rhodothermales bacterium]